MLRESGVKLAEEMGCRMRGMVKRKLLCSVMSYTGFMVEVTQCENARLPVQINVEEALLARVFPVLGRHRTRVNVRHLKTTANVT